MSKLDDVLSSDNFVPEIYDYEEAKTQIKEVIREIIDETFDKDDAKAQEFWRKIEEL